MCDHLVYIFCGHLEYFMAILVNVSPFWYVAQRKIWQPWSQVTSVNMKWVVVCAVIAFGCVSADILESGHAGAFPKAACETRCLSYQKLQLLVYKYL
jgi:hypothetical protein